MTETPTPRDFILVKRGEPILATAGLDEAAHLIEQIYPGAWEVLPHSEEYPYDFRVVTGGGERTILEGPIGHENLARFFVQFQPSTIRAILADNQRLRTENTALREGKSTWPES
jgi:hypothetical protein